MARSFDFKRRGVPRRKRKPTYLIIAEGRNKTETNYFSHFQDQEKPYILRMVKAGSNTDIESLYKTICNRWEELELSEEEGDCAFIVFDLDNTCISAFMIFMKKIKEDKYIDRKSVV